MRHVFTAAFFVSLAACMPSLQQHYKDPRDITGIDPVFDHYIEIYKAHKRRGFDYDIPIQLADLASGGSSTIGLCTRWSNGYRQIQIDRSYWQDPSTTEQERMSLIFHELGHCDLNRSHSTTILSNGWPVSFMYPYNYGYIPSMEDYYFNELFNPNVMPITKLASHNGCVHDIKVE